MPRWAQAYVEIPLDRDPAPLVAAIARRGGRAKMRTGGVTPDAFPPAEAVARFLRACTDAGVPFKATAGTPPPLRAEYRLTYAPDSPRGTMFGFLNVFLAAALHAARHGERGRGPAAGGARPRGDPLRRPTRVEWQGHRLDRSAIAAARATGIVAFGSCSFTEPVGELQAISHPPAPDRFLTDTRTALENGLRGRYALERELGRGGMATVYLAQDLKHERPVALKVLRPALAMSMGPDRFRREITTAARLQHPHILSVHDSGETEGLLWYTMPYVRGESLRDRLKREGRLPLGEAFRITSEAGRALDYAHREGVIHRDIKPENILLTLDGDTLVADFGIARALGKPEREPAHAGGPRARHARVHGARAGHRRARGGRADRPVLARGRVLRDAGRPPAVRGHTGAAIIARRFTAPDAGVATRSVPRCPRPPSAPCSGRWRSTRRTGSRRWPSSSARSARRRRRRPRACPRSPSPRSSRPRRRRYLVAARLARAPACWCPPRSRWWRRW